MTPDNEQASAARRVLLDARGKPCPYPVIVVGKYAREVRTTAGMNPCVTLIASDPAARGDVSAWARMVGATIVSVEETAVCAEGTATTEALTLRFEIDIDV